MSQVEAPKPKMSAWKLRFMEFMALRVFIPGIPKLRKNIPVELPAGFEQEYIAALKNGDLATAVSSHDSHANALGAMNLSTKMWEIAHDAGLDYPTSIMIPVAASLLSGNQDPTLKKMVDAVMPQVYKAHIEPVASIRGKDRDVYDMKGSNRDLLRGFDRAGRENKGILFFPEGSVQAGRTRPDGTRYGMIEPKEPLLDWMVRHFDNQGRELFIMPVGMYGGFKILSADSLRPTMRAYLAVAGVPGIDLGWVKVGPPKRISEIRKQIIGKDLDHPRPFQHFILKQMVAPVLPLEARGIYK